MRVIIAGGGTAGHINPGIAIAKYIKQKEKNADIIFVGTINGLEKDLVPREGFELRFIRAKGFKRKLSFDTIKTIKEIFLGFSDARKILKEFKPDIVIGTGGYVCGPILFVASRMRIPTLIHEQNAFPGVTNKILSKFVNKVAISFEESKKYFMNSEKLILTGNPIRSELLNSGFSDKIEARKRLRIQDEKPLVLIFGGSRGARVVNETVSKMLKNYFDESYRVIFATGEALYESIKDNLKGNESECVKIEPYIYNMGEVLLASDIVVSRAGAITISEISAIGCPSILIPSPYVTANHQEYNARVLEKENGAVVILEKDIEPKKLHEKIKTLLMDKNLLKKMSDGAKKIAVTNATERIYLIIKDLIKK